MSQFDWHFTSNHNSLQLFTTSTYSIFQFLFENLQFDHNQLTRFRVYNNLVIFFFPPTFAFQLLNSYNSLTHYAKGTPFSSDCFPHIISRSFHSIFMVLFIFPSRYYSLLIIELYFQFEGDSSIFLFFSFTFFFGWWMSVFNTGHFLPCFFFYVLAALGADPFASMIFQIIEAFFSGPPLQFTRSPAYATPPMLCFTFFGFHSPLLSISLLISFPLINQQFQFIRYILFRYEWWYQRYHNLNTTNSGFPFGHSYITNYLHKSLDIIPPIHSMFRYS